MEDQDARIKLTRLLKILLCAFIMKFTSPSIKSTSSFVFSVMGY